MKPWVRAIIYWGIPILSFIVSGYISPVVRSKTSVSDAQSVFVRPNGFMSTIRYTYDHLHGEEWLDVENSFHSILGRDDRRYVLSHTCECITAIRIYRYPGHLSLYRHKNDRNQVNVHQNFISHVETSVPLSDYKPLFDEGEQAIIEMRKRFASQIK